MRTLLLAAAVLAPAALAHAQGTVRSDRGVVEVLPPRSAVEIRTPEGFIRAEGPATPGPTGSFGVYRSPGGGAYGSSGGAATPPLAVVEPPATPRYDPCRAERRAYLRRLLRMSGIDLEDPLAFVEGLAGAQGYTGALLFSAYGLLPGVDPVKPLAWDLELRRLARELATCQGSAQ